MLWSYDTSRQSSFYRDSRCGLWIGARMRPPRVSRVARTCSLARGNPEVILIASGSELTLAVDAHEKLIVEGIRSRVVSMPSWEIFDHQPQEYRDSVLPASVKARVAVEQASTFGWERYVGSFGQVIGMKTFGASAPLKALQKKFGFEPARVAATARELLGKL